MTETVPENALDLNYPPCPRSASSWQKFCTKFHRFILIDEHHPTTMEYFRSEIAILREKQRHYRHFKYSIHPLSKFNQYYEIWCFFFYGWLLFFKAYDFGFIRINVRGPFKSHREIAIIALILDSLSLTTIVLQFFIGFPVDNLRFIELSRSKISLRYLTNGYFVCDLFSSIPRILTWNSESDLFILVMCLTLLKLRRIPTFISLIKPVATFFRIRSSSKTFLFGFFFLVALVTHVMTCLHAGLPRIRNAIEQAFNVKSYLTFYMVTQNSFRQYMITFLKNAQYTFLIKVAYLRDSLLPEEMTLSILNYLVGTVLKATIWIVLVYTFLSKRVLRVRFEEVMTELNEYMGSKQLPPELKKRLVTYYTFKYQKAFFNESFIRSVFSENLKREIDVFLCKSLIQRVSMFSDVSSRTVKQIIGHLIPEIYMPSDLIIQSATIGDCMYFIESGTVAVFTPSGQEICHLQDGAYFGEVSVLMKDQKRTATVIAIETTRTFRLNKEDFDVCLTKQDPAYLALLKVAKERIEATKNIEIKFKAVLLTQNHRDSLVYDVE